MACQTPLSMEFSRQEYWSGLSFPSGNLSDPGIKPGSPVLQADCLPSEPPGKPHTESTAVAMDVVCLVHHKFNQSLYSFCDVSDTALTEL